MHKIARKANQTNKRTRIQILNQKLSTYSKKLINLFLSNRFLSPLFPSSQLFQQNIYLSWRRKIPQFQLLMALSSIFSLSVKCLPLSSSKSKLPSSLQPRKQIALVSQTNPQKDQIQGESCYSFLPYFPSSDGGFFRPCMSLPSLT